MEKPYLTAVPTIQPMVDGKEVEMTKELLEQGAQFVHPAMTFMGFEGKPKKPSS